MHNQCCNIAQDFVLSSSAADKTVEFIFPQEHSYINIRFKDSFWLSWIHENFWTTYLLLILFLLSAALHNLRPYGHMRPSIIIIVMQFAAVHR